MLGEVVMLLPSRYCTLSVSYTHLVPHVKIRDLQNQPIDLPYLGKAPLLLFYVDPDHAGQNSDFIAYLEEHQIGGDKIQAYGIVNLKDAPLLPNGVVRSMMRSKQKKTGAAMYTDVDCSLRDACLLYTSPLLRQLLGRDRRRTDRAVGEGGVSGRDGLQEPGEGPTCATGGDGAQRQPPRGPLPVGSGLAGLCTSFYRAVAFGEDAGRGTAE